MKPPNDGIATECTAGIMWLPFFIELSAAPSLLSSVNFRGLDNLPTVLLPTKALMIPDNRFNYLIANAFGVSKRCGLTWESSSMG